jgi:hypothetical protein
MEDDRRTRNRLPLKMIMTMALALSAIWLLELYMAPTWAKIVSFVLGYLVGTLVNEWVHQRSSRAEDLPAPAVARSGQP